MSYSHFSIDGGEELFQIQIINKFGPRSQIAKVMISQRFVSYWHSPYLACYLQPLCFPRHVILLPLRWLTKYINSTQAQQFKILQFSGLRSSASPPVTLSHSGSFSYFVGASNVCFVPPRPALMNIPAAFLSVMGMRVWRVSRPTSRPRKPPFFAPRTS